MPAEPDDEWWDDAAGPVVRPFAVTGGRTRSAQARLDVTTRVVATGAHRDRMGLEPEHLTILRMCQRPLSVAELAAYLNVPLMVVEILVSDLVERGDVMTGAPPRIDEAPDRDLLQAVLDGICAL